MASDGSDTEGNPLSTPSKKTPKRATSRQIIRWSDEKLAFAFAEFRLAAQRQRIDIKKALDEAAKAVAPFVTGDALVQQLTKRRARYIQDQEEGKGNSGPQSVRKTPKKHTNNFKVEPTDGEHVQVLETPTSSVKQNPRSTKTISRQNIKQELQKGISDSESEYTESPSKSRNKRTRAKKAIQKKRKKRALESRNEEDKNVDVDEAEDEIPPVPGAASPTTNSPTRHIKSKLHKNQKPIRGLTARKLEKNLNDQHAVQSTDQHHSLQINSTSQSNTDGASALSIHGLEYDGFASYDQANLKFPHLDEISLHEPLQPPNEPFEEKGQELCRDMTFTKYVPHASEIGQPMSFNLISPSDESSDQSKSFGRHYNTTSSFHVHEDCKHVQNISSNFSSSGSWQVTLYTATQAACLEGSSGTDTVALGRTSSPSFNEYSTLINEDQDDFRLCEETEQLDEDGDQDQDKDEAGTSTPKQIARHHEEWSYRRE
ncbi:hypothetical protein, variant [Verruconis gallopava]|nr:hypothetical protein, variant [Verruconis gallopava]KIW09593.1 hypothetical protein, variant [Verruconis gallopava]